MHLRRPLALILSLAACEHASNATSTSTLPEEAAPAPNVEEPAPAPEAKLVAPTPTPEPKTIAREECPPPRMTRAAVKWKEGCEPERVTKKPLAPSTATPDAAGTAKP